MKYQDDVIYRFRPRRNDAVNGFFICDEGRLSYKYLQENRQESILLYEEETQENKALQELKNLIENYKEKITLIVDANLFTEEIGALVAFAKSISATLYSPLEIYKDENFKDDMLKSANRAANYKTIENLNINTTLPTKNALVINFNHPLDFEADVQINFTTHKREKNRLTFPIAAFSENAGHLTNEDSIMQECQKAVFKNNPAPTIVEWLQKVRS
jgi:NADH-quinone oxidoreductase subunit G